MILIKRVGIECLGTCLMHDRANGCIHPPPVAGQCSFPKLTATKLCSEWSLCLSLNCNKLRSDCQARDQHAKLHRSFGDADAYVMKDDNKRIHSELQLLTDPKFEEKAYSEKFQHDYFLYDALYVYRTFFSHYANKGFFIESGGFDGTAHGSNTYYYERYKQWSGLLVEASPTNCYHLRKRRSESSQVSIECTALCSKTGRRSFSTNEGGCCGRVGGPNALGPITVQCTRTQAILHKFNVTRVDFWSLDVEGNEYNVLNGLDWSIPVYVFLIEGVTHNIRRLLRSKGYRHHAMDSPSTLNQIWFQPNYTPKSVLN